MIPETGEAVKNAILIAGPTASGKSALAVELALAKGGVIINADSMQVYSVLDRLTARPPAEDLAAVPHHLFGTVHPGVPWSTGHWLRAVETLLATGLDGRVPVFVGGTGLYFSALLGGLSQMPDIPPAVRAYWRARLEREGDAALHGELSRLDPAGAQRLRASDGQRIVRALEVLEATGRPISYWQGQTGRALVDPATAHAIVLEPDRAWLARRIEARLRAMAATGGLEEVRALLDLGLDPAMPAMKAIGVREFGAVLDGSAELEEAIRHAATATRQYAKRQMTWFRNQLGASWQRQAVP